MVAPLVELASPVKVPPFKVKPLYNKSKPILSKVAPATFNVTARLILKLPKFWALKFPTNVKLLLVVVQPLVLK